VKSIKQFSSNNFKCVYYTNTNYFNYFTTGIQHYVIRCRPTIIISLSVISLLRFRSVENFIKLSVINAVHYGLNFSYIIG